MDEFEPFPIGTKRLAEVLLAGPQSLADAALLAAYLDVAVVHPGEQDTSRFARATKQFKAYLRAAGESEKASLRQYSPSTYEDYACRVVRGELRGSSSNVA